MRSSEIRIPAAGRIAVWDTEAEGLAVLLIHGNSACKEIFRHQFESELARRLRLIAFDLPGHGDSDDADDAEEAARMYTIGGYARAARHVLTALGVRRAVVFGWSLGGHVALEMMPRSRTLAGVMICGTPPVPASPEGLGQGFAPTPLMALTGARHWSADEAETFARAACGAAFEPFMLDAARRTDGRARECFLADAMAGAPADERRIVESSALPLAIVNGAEDPFLNHAYFEEPRYANLWQGRVHRLEGVGHAPFWDDPAGFNRLLARFVADVGA
jgi:pimeloyl-ACP methyl ester carboxylesterase